MIYGHVTKLLSFISDLKKSEACTINATEQLLSTILFRPHGERMLRAKLKLSSFKNIVKSQVTYNRKSKDPHFFVVVSFEKRQKISSLESALLLQMSKIDK